MSRRLILLLAILGAMIAHPAYAADGAGDDAPGVKQYEFARSYITALSYMKDIDDRWDKNVSREAANDVSTPQQRNKTIIISINDLSLDSSDLLIIKHYLLKYMASSDMLMRKVADIVVEATDRDIAVNHEEKILWEKWYDLNAAGQETRTKEIDFVKTQHSLELQRKEADKDIIQASVLMTKVLISGKSKNVKDHRLAITAQQRQKLLDKLDSFGSDDLDWGLKTGQRTLEGSIAVIREILEDSLWTSIDEK